MTSMLVKFFPSSFIFLRMQWTKTFELSAFPMRRLYLHSQGHLKIGHRYTWKSNINVNILIYWTIFQEKKLRPKYVQIIKMKRHFRRRWLTFVTFIFFKWKNKRKQEQWEVLYQTHGPLLRKKTICVVCLVFIRCREKQTQQSFSCIMFYRYELVFGLFLKNEIVNA